MLEALADSLVDALSLVRLVAKLKGSTGVGDVKRNDFLFFAIMHRAVEPCLALCDSFGVVHRDLCLQMLAYGHLSISIAQLIVAIVSRPLSPVRAICNWKCGCTRYSNNK